jgi:hypothetical protein
VMGALLAVQKGWSAHVDEHVVGRAAALHHLAGWVAMGLVAAALRVYFDLVEVYTVQLGLAGDKRVRKALGPAWRGLRGRFAGAYAVFVLLTLAGMSAVMVTARMAMHSLAQPRVWPMFLLAQAGLFVMLLTRFWQRGAETVLAVDDPIVVVEPVVVVTPQVVVATEPVVDPVDPEIL